MQFKIKYSDYYFSCERSTSLVIGCEQPLLLFGYGITGKGGGAATTSQQSRRGEWGEEKWACTRAVDFLIPSVRWRTQRSDWLKMTDDRIQCNLSACHVTLPSWRLWTLFKEHYSSFRLFWTKTRAENSCELFTGREECFAVMLLFQLFSSPQWSNRRTFQKESIRTVWF